MTQPSRLPGVELSVDRSDALAAPESEQLHDLFAETYAQPNHEYLDKSLGCLRYIARARAGDSLVAFALADSRFSELPGFDQSQLVLLGGIGCVRDEYRRSGLFSLLAGRAAHGSGLLGTNKGRLLACGRMAHPAGFRPLRRFSGVVPDTAKALSTWHLDVAAALARLYGARLRDESLVVTGSGRPIGYPRIEIDIDAEEWLPFAGVDRDRGDSLLAFAWVPDAPPGW